MAASQHSLLAACFTLRSINATLVIVPQRGAGLWNVCCVCLGPITAAARTWVCTASYRLNSGIVGSIPTWHMCVWIFSLCYVVLRRPRSSDGPIPRQRSPKPRETGGTDPHWLVYSSTQEGTHTYLQYLISLTLHSRCGINKGLIKRGSTIDH
jgi:hypothetical protein